MGRLDVQLRGVDPRGNLGRVAEAARQFVFQQLLACGFGDHWALRFVNGITWKVEPPAMKAIAVQHHAIRLKTKTGDNSTAVEWLLVPPGTYQADIVLVKLRESLSRNVLEVPDEEPVAAAAVVTRGPGRPRHVLQSPMSEVSVYNPTSEIEEILKEPVMSSVPHPVVSAGKNGTPEAKPLLGGPMHTTSHSALPAAPPKLAAPAPAAPRPAAPAASSHAAILDSLRALADSAGRSDARRAKLECLEQKSARLKDERAELDDQIKDLDDQIMAIMQESEADKDAAGAEETLNSLQRLLASRPLK